MTNIYIDNKKYEVRSRSNLLQACLSIGFDIPYFCWHPILGSIGACRQCAVKQYQDSKNKHDKLIMSCMTPVTEGINISINDEEAKKFRKDIIELLMINHPHDCPVCEEGGNCHLQDMTVMTGHNSRNYRFTKRTHKNQNLGPFISHEMNRCIVCYRCIRYYKDYADGKDLGVYGMHDNIYFGRLEDGTLESEFSGNLVEICPTGVFTDKTYSEHYSRKWDMQFAPSICQQCSIGCNINPGERYGKLRRIENRYNNAINHYFLCDRGRFGYGYVNLKNRPRQPIQYYNNKSIILNFDEAIQKAIDILRNSNKIIGIGSSRASIESNFALRELVGENNFCTGLNQIEQECIQTALKILIESGVYIPTLREIESYDAILILGEDITQTAARVALAVRQAVKNKAREIASEQKIEDWQADAIMHIGQQAKNPLFITSTDSTGLDDISEWNYYAPIEDQARLGFAVAHALDFKAPSVKNLNSNLKDKANLIAQKLSEAKKPLIISGTNCASISILQAASNISQALKYRKINVGITMIASTVNSIGLGIINGISLDKILQKLKYNTVDSVIILENDLYRNAHAYDIEKAFKKVSQIIVIDHQYTEIMNKASLILSAASFVEGSGTVINNEGRAQRFFQVYNPSYYDNNNIILDSWRWLYSIYSIIKKVDRNWIQLDNIINKISNKIPQLANIRYASPSANFRINGQKLARQPYCHSGRTAIYANNNIHEPRQPQDKDTMFTFSMEGSNQPHAHRSDIPFVWAPGWNSLQAWNKFQNEIADNLYNGDPGIRLIDISNNKLGYFNNVPPYFRYQIGKWRVVPCYHLFGSEELSQLSPIFQSRMPQPYIKLNSTDASQLGLNAGANISFNYNKKIISLKLIISDKLSTGQVGLPIGMFGITSILINTYLNNSINKKTEFKLLNN